MVGIYIYIKFNTNISLYYNTTTTIMVENICNICCEPYNKSTRKKISCPLNHCKYTACKKCIRSYLISTTQDPHCMKCRGAWDQQFMVLQLNRSFITNEYARHRRKLLLEKEMSLVPATMHMASQRQQKDKELENLKALQKDINALYAQISVIRRKQHNIRRNIRQLDIQPPSEHEERTKFIMPCPVSDCRGFLSSQYRCEICKIYTCSKCLEPIGYSKKDPHACIESSIQNAELIKKETKPCPSCGTRIMKIPGGCDQMWCVECHQAFSWRFGKLDNGPIHNPHFYEFKRKQNNGTIIRAPGDILCGGLCSWQQLHRISSNLYFTKDNTDEKDHIKNILYMIHRMNTHISRIDLPSLRQRIALLENGSSLRINYILKEISIKTLEKQCYRNDTTRRKLTELLRVYELLSICGIELFIRLINEKTKKEKEYNKEVNKELSNYNELRKYCNEQFKIISITYNQQVPQITDVWQIRSKKFNISEK